MAIRPYILDLKIPSETDEGYSLAKNEISSKLLCLSILRRLKGT